MPGVLSASLVNGALEVHLADGTPPAALVAMLVQRGVGIDEVRRERRSLEEAFLELVSDDAGSGKRTEGSR